MSKTNPDLSIKAMFPREIDCGFGVVVKPLTLGHYALLEKIDSYLVNGNHAPDSLEVIKTFFICTHSAREVLSDFDNLESRAFEWAESLPPTMTGAISDAILEQIDLMAKVIPHVGNDSKKKALVMDS